MAQSPQPEGAARSPSPGGGGGGPRSRCVALVCHSWGHASTFYTWNWAKQYLLRRGPDGRLDPSEQLFIVKASVGEGLVPAAGCAYLSANRSLLHCSTTLLPPFAGGQG